MTQRYDAIGAGYAHRRRTDPRIARAIHDALGDANSVVNVGAGSGSYEPADRRVVAVEPACTMIEQRPLGAAPCVRAAAERLPFRSAAFDVAMATLTVHHWADRVTGLAEMRRVAAQQVIFFFEPAKTDAAWIMQYWPEIRDLPSEVDPPGEECFRGLLDVRELRVVPIPSDCIDGFGGAYWARPEAYLDPAVRAGMSSFAQLESAATVRGHNRLRDDLESGAWDARFGALRELPEYDVGYRIVIAGEPRAN